MVDTKKSWVGVGFFSNRQARRIDLFSNELAFEETSNMGIERDIKS